MSVESDGSVKPCASAVYDFSAPDGKSRAREFFELCTLAILTMRRWTFAFKWTLDEAMRCDAFRLRNIVAASPVGCVVVRYQTTDAATGAVAKRLAKFAVPEKDDAAERFDNEKKNVAMLKARGFAVGKRAKVDTVLGHEAIVFDDDDGAVSVELLVESLGSDATNLAAIAKLVDEKISTLLAALHAAGLVFVDIHPGNVVVVCDAAGAPIDAWLIDYECVCAVGTPLAEKRILGRKEFVPRSYSDDGATASTAGDVESLRLVLAWILNVEGFRSLVSTARSGDSVSGRLQWSGKKDDVLPVVLALTTKWRASAATSSGASAAPAVGASAAAAAAASSSSSSSSAPSASTSTSRSRRNK